jgi:Lipopolysaccharide-assembly
LNIFEILKLIMKNIKFILFCIVGLIINGCSVYNFTGTGKIDAKTFQVTYFQNVAELIEPGIDRDFTFRLQDLIQNQTNLNLLTSNGDLTFEGEIVDYRISPMTATADLVAAQSRLTIVVNVRFSNKNKPTEDFEKRFTHFDDYPGNNLPTGTQLRNSLDVIFDRITQDIFNETLAKW